MITDLMLLAYLEESLPSESMSFIEIALRDDEELRRRLSLLIGRRDSGVHTVGDIWRRHRLSCPPREELGSYLLGAMMDDQADYIKFHLEQIGCRFCQSNLDDLSASHHRDAVIARRRKYFQSSVGRLRSEGIG
ncbi:MAG: hypothetical protein ACOVLE_06655 [Pirellula staleyi]